MSSQVSITVLMTVYNGAAYLKKAIESVLAQSFRDFEFLIIDDCSQDDSVAIVRSFVDQRIVLHCNQTNVGQTKSLNIGLRMARGEFIARMDADDFAFESWLKEQVSGIRRFKKECVLVSSRAVIIDGNGNTHKTLNTPLSSTEIEVKSLWASPVNHVGVLMRRQAVLDQGGYDEVFRIAADYALWSTFLRKGFSLAVTNRPLVAIRSHAASVTAVAAGRTDITEVSCIMSENIRHWAGVSLEEARAHSLWHFIYNVENCNVEQIMSGYDLFCQIRQGFMGRTRHAPRTVHGIFARQARIVFIKKVFDCIKKKDISGLRWVTRFYIEKHGFCNIFLFIWILSCVPMMLFCLPLIYLKYRRMIVNWRMG